MNDHYKTLGVDQTASPDDIKKAYRSLAMKHHPDRGGDQALFKNISVAYDTLSDPQKRAEYDQMQMGGPQVRFHTGGMPDFADIFGAQFGGGSPFGDLFGRRMQRNRDLNIQCQISLFDSYVGKQFEANYSLPSGKNQTVVINIPPGISHGETIRYQGLGDDSVPGIARGSLNVTIVVLPDQNFSRVNDDLYATIHISPIEAMVGCSKKVKQITGQEVSLVLRAGVESGTEFASTNGGFSNPHTGNKGRFVTVVKIRTPAITDPMLVEKLKQIDNEINKKS